MANTYKIGNKVIDLNKLISVGDLRSDFSGLITLPLIFNFNSNVEVQFNSGEDGVPDYHNPDSDWTDMNSDFGRYVVEQRDNLLLIWAKNNPE